MINTLILIWVVISIITLILEFATAKKISDDEKFMEEFMKLYDAEKFDKISKKKTWIFCSLCPVLNIFYCLAFIVLFVLSIVDFDFLREKIILQVQKELNAIEG